LVQLRDIASQFTELGFQLIGISPDQPSKVRATIEKHSIPFTLLSDRAMTASKALGIAYQVDEGALKALAKYGVDLLVASGQAHHLLPVPAVFVVDSNGIVQFEYINPDYSVRAHPELLLIAVRLARPGGREQVPTPAEV
jgi:peroxiredoxin